MSKKQNLRHELLAVQYLEALDQGDWDTVSQLWEQAETDAVLESMLTSLGAGLLEEAGWNETLAEDADAVRSLIKTHLSQRPASSVQQALTAADVVSQLQASHRRGELSLSAEEELALEAIRKSHQPLPDRITRTSLDQWAELTNLELTNLKAGPHFWREFRRVATLLAMGRNQESTQLAAREQKKPPSSERHD